jgi:chemotaxis signal transduction protein
MDRLLTHMPVVVAYGQRLTALQTVWDSLSLLSQMSGDGTDMGRTRQAFEMLSRELVSQLAAETRQKALQELGARAQVTIDVLVRNLFERTADIGFLCLDDQIIDFLQARGGDAPQDPRAHAALCRRLREYADKYSVYQDVVLLGTDGLVVARLDDTADVARSADPLIAEALTTGRPYVERYAPSDLYPGQGPVLLYAWRVARDGRNLGVLCLRFRFEDEMRAIFAKLLGSDDWTVLTLVEPSGRVVTSSDPWQIPQGAPLTLARSGQPEVARFAGREYLAATRDTQGYQGYAGPGWVAHALVPLEQAFAQRVALELAGIDPALLARVQRGADVFAPELRAIPERADAIQRELTQAVWNGNVRLSAGQAQDNAFSRSLLREISATGLRTMEVFERSISDLLETVVSSLLHDCRFRASLAIDILDRNLYERANDCRWWAMNGTLAAALVRGDAAVAGSVLERINALYTVYDNLILFDREQRVLAVSNPARRELQGKRIPAAWARNALALADSQSFAVSPFEPLDSYDGRATWVFAAAVRGPDRRVVGGIGIVFDSDPQLAAMVRDVLPPGDAETHCAVYVDDEGKVIAASSRFKVGERLDLSPALLAPPAEGAMGFIAHEGRYYAVGSRRAAGYREFTGLPVCAVMLSSVGPVETEAALKLSPFTLARRTIARSDALDIATVACGGQWLALPARSVVQALHDVRATRLAASSPWLIGVIDHQGVMVPLVDLARLLGREGAGTATVMVIVREAEQMLGLAVDALGDVLEIAIDEISPVDAATAAGQGPLLTPRILRARAPGDTAPLMLDLAAVLRATRPATQ